MGDLPALADTIVPDWVVVLVLIHSASTLHARTQTHTHTYKYLTQLH